MTQQHKRLIKCQYQRPVRVRWSTALKHPGPWLQLISFSYRTLFLDHKSGRKLVDYCNRIVHYRNMLFFLPASRSRCSSSAVSTTASPKRYMRTSVVPLPSYSSHYSSILLYIPPNEPHRLPTAAAPAHL